MMSLEKYYHQFKRISLSKSFRLPMPMEVEWYNCISSNNTYRQIHVEYYQDKKMEVIHLLCLPHYEYDVPIFGADLIKMGNKKTLFLDFSPIGHRTVDKDLFPFDHTKMNISEWAKDIFSKDYIAVRTNESDENLIEYIEKNFILSLRLKGVQKINTKTCQEKYCLNQRKNRHTLTALIKKIGEQKASQFMNDVLFPL